MPPQRTILNALQDLTNEKFHEFCHELTALDEEPRVRTAEVEGKSRVVITELLVSRYGQSEALSRTITTLRVIGCNDEAERLGEMDLVSRAEFYRINSLLINRKSHKSQTCIK
uniref:Pyrin domain-containing protein n=1 Tax=Neogobius melanostomus TaxID=47308 RepID=A0A8C6U4G6_9GOBI